MNTITYTLENGTKIVQPINKECFVNQKGNPVSKGTLHQLFADTAWDKRAVKYTIDSETNESVTTEKEIHFTKNERKVAKRDYKDFMKSNSNGFKQSLRTFQKQFVDVGSSSRRIRMNLNKVILQ